MHDVHTATHVVRDVDETFDVLVIRPPASITLALFAAGAGGDPHRHLPLLQRVAARGCLVVAPKCDRLPSPTPGAGELALRGRRLVRALHCVEAKDRSRVIGIGHSIGAAVLLILSGGVATTRAGDTLRFAVADRFSRLALMAPPTDFFRASDSLQDVTASIAIWAGAMDDIAPPRAMAVVSDGLRGIAPVQVRIAQNANHFSFMDIPPPQARVFAGQNAFLARVADEVADFAVG